VSEETITGNNRKKPSRSFQLQLKEAEVYLQQGLFDEAETIYASIREKLQNRLDADVSEKSLRPSERSRLLDSVASLDRRLRTVAQKRLTLLDSVGGSIKKVDPDLSPENMIERGLLLQGMGFYEEAIDEYKRAATQKPELVSKCYELMGTSLIGKNELDAGIDMLRQALALEKTQEKNQIAILNKIAGAYEAYGKKQQALSTYREIILLNSDYGQALFKIEQLSAELKRSPLELSALCYYPKTCLIISLLIALLFIAFNPFVKIANNVDNFTVGNNPDIVFYNNFKKIFGNDEFFIIAFQCDDLFSPDRLTMLKRITEKLVALDEVEDVVSLANVNDMIGEADYFEVRKFLDKIPKKKSDLGALEQSAVKNPLYSKNLISPDGKTTAIVVKPHEKPEDNDFRKRLLSKTNDILKPYESGGIHFHLGGWTTTNLSLSQYLNADLMIFVPATYVLIALSTWLFFRNVRLTLLAIANITLAVGATRGLMGMLGVMVNSVTVIIIPLIMALSLSDTVHIFSHMDSRLLDRFSDEKKAMAHVLNRVGLPCFLTTLTTAIGFFSLAVSEIPPIREFAWISSAGMVFEFLFSFFFLPPLIILFFNPKNLYQAYEDSTALTGFFRGLFHIVTRYTRWIIVLCVLFSILASLATTRLKIETNLLESFKRSSPVRIALDFVEGHLAGVGSLDISLQSQEAEAFKDPANLALVERAQKAVSDLEGVDKTISLTDFLKKMNQAFHEDNISFYRIPASSDLISQYLLLYNADDLEDYVNNEFNHARISVRISVHGSEGQKRLIKRIETILQPLHSSGLQVRVTGRAVKEVSIVDSLVKSQIYSLASAALVISVIFLLVFRSVSLALLSMIPNIFPIILNFGIMGVTGIALDTGTALISAVALGIVVDDTIHFLIEYQRQRAQGIGVRDAVELVILQKGLGMISSSVIVFIAFGIMVLSRFMPVVHFGLLCAIIMVTALIGDMVLLPAVLLLKEHRTPKEKNRRRSEVV
jgi:uncharacterized protein